MDTTMSSDVALESKDKDRDGENKPEKDSKKDADSCYRYDENNVLIYTDPSSKKVMREHGVVRLLQVHADRQQPEAAVGAQVVGTLSSNGGQKYPAAVPHDIYNSSFELVHVQHKLNKQFDLSEIIAVLSIFSSAKWKYFLTILAKLTMRSEQSDKSNNLSQNEKNIVQQCDQAISIVNIEYFTLHDENYR